MMRGNFSCRCADYLESGEEGADDWVGSRILVEFVGKGFLRVFMKLMMKMASNGNGRKVVKRITDEDEIGVEDYGVKKIKDDEIGVEEGFAVELTGIPHETLRRLIHEHAWRLNLFMALHS
nr:shaggy-related protein kinase kappa [Ipomoea batatas]